MIVAIFSTLQKFEAYKFKIPNNEPFVKTQPLQIGLPVLKILSSYFLHFFILGLDMHVDTKLY